MATAIEQNSHLNRCLVYIDLNMVRPGVVEHPKLWPFCGYNEIQDPPDRYRIIDLNSLTRLMGFTDLHDLQSAHKKWIEASLCIDEPERQSHWTESIAAGSKAFVEEVKTSLGFKSKGKSITAGKDYYQLRESASPFNATSWVESAQRSDTAETNTFAWREIS